MLDRLPIFVIIYPMLLFSLSCHEAAHAWMANRYGDPTARLLGRISLNPIKHIDWIGTFLLPVIGLLNGISLIGWAKPVPVNMYNLRDPRKDEIWISASGPITNLILASIFASIVWILHYMVEDAKYHMFKSFNLFLVKAVIPSDPLGIAGIVLILGVMMNLTLAFFNLIPVPPLDGSGIVRGLLPEKSIAKFDSFSRYGFIIIILLLITGALRILLYPVIYILQWMLP